MSSTTYPAGVLDRLEFVYEPDLYRVTNSDLVDVTFPLRDGRAAFESATRPRAKPS